MSEWPEGWGWNVTQEAERIRFEALPPDSSYGGRSEESLTLDDAEDDGKLDEALAKLAVKVRRRADDRIEHIKKTQDLESRVNRIRERVRERIKVKDRRESSGLSDLTGKAVFLRPAEFEVREARDIGPSDPPA